jgi:hypothetical protein
MRTSALLVLIADGEVNMLTTRGLVAFVDAT